jgi:peroxiredoxin
MILFQVPHLALRRAVSALCAGMVTLALSACGAREQARDFSYTLLDGSRAHTAQMRGKVLLVNFWATTCVTCVQEMPRMVATQQKFQGRGYETLAVAMNYDAPARVADFAASRKLPFGVVIDNTGAIAKGFGDIPGTPTTFLIDKKGAIVKRFVGEPDFAVLHVLVEKLLAES